MASNAVNKIDLASVKDIDALSKSIADTKTKSIQSSNKAFQLVVQINSLMDEQRKNLSQIRQDNSAGLKLYNALIDQFKTLGMELPKDIEAKLEGMDKMARELQSTIIGNMTNVKNQIDNKY